MINIYLTLTLITLTQSRDETNPTGFVKKLFDFSYPPENIYPISLSTFKINTRWPNGQLHQSIWGFQ